MTVGHCYVESDGTLAFANAEQHAEIMTAGIYDPGNRVHESIQAEKRPKKKCMKKKQASSINLRKRLARRQQASSM